MTIERLTRDNFALTSLDAFVRTQPVTEVYRKIGGEYQLVRAPFTDDWTPARKREKAAELLSGACTAYGAWLDGRLAGFIQLSNALNNGRLVVDSLHVSQNARRHGIGRALFAQALAEARARGAGRLYFSACSARETISFYLAMGCRLTDDPIPEAVEAEPFDLQLVCDVEGNSREPVVQPRESVV